MEKLTKDTNRNRCISKKTNILNKYVKILKRIGSKSAYGEVYQACYPAKDCKNYIAVKKIAISDSDKKYIKKPDSMESLENSVSCREIFFLRLCNLIRMEGISMHLPLTYSYHTCNRCKTDKKDSGVCVLLLTELADGDLSNYMTEQSPALEDIKIVYFQIYTAIYCIWKYFKIVHNDLHYGNVLIYKTKKGGYIKYKFDDKEVIIPNNGVIITLWDFGLSYIHKVLKPSISYQESTSPDSESSIWFSESDSKSEITYSVNPYLVDYIRITKMLLNYSDDDVKLPSSFDRLGKKLLNILDKTDKPKKILENSAKLFNFNQKVKEEEIIYTFDLNRKI